MPYYTKPDYSRQLKQYSGTSAVFSGQTNILEKFSIKSIEIDTANAIDGNLLIYDAINNKFAPGLIGSFGSGILQGLQLTYNSGLTYDVSYGKYKIGSNVYEYSGGSVNILSGQSGGSRLDIVYITTAQTPYVRAGITIINPSVPSLSGGELEIGIILVPANFTGGTGSTVIQATSTTVFEYYPAGTGIQRLPNSTNAQAPGDFSFALTRNSISYGQDSVALGYYSIVSGNSQTVVGQYNTPNTTDYFIIGNGISDGSRSNAFSVTNSGDTYVNNNLFVKNIEIDTSSATDSQVLKFDGTKFKPQLETVTGVTSIAGGISIFSSITNNSIILKSLSGGSNVTVFESGGTIFVSVELSGASLSGLTEIVSLTGGTSIISGKTGSTYFLYPIQGSGGTQVVLSNNRILIYSDTSASTTGANVGPVAAAAVFSGKTLNELRFRRLSSITSNYLTIAESAGLNELVLFTSIPPITGSTNATGTTVGVLSNVSGRNIIGRAISGANRAVVTQAADLITINSPIEVQTGDVGVLAMYRSSSPVVYSSFTSANISGITVRLGTHTAPLGTGISNSGVTSSYEEITPQYFSGTSFIISGFNFNITGTGIQTFINSNNTASYISLGDCCFGGASYSIDSVFNVLSFDVITESGFTLYTSYTYTAQSNNTRTYTIPDTRRNASFVMTEANQTINGIKNFISGFTIGTSPITTPNVFLQASSFPTTPFWANQEPYNTYSLFSDPNNRYVLGYGGVPYESVYLFAGYEVFMMPWVSEYIRKSINPLTRTKFSSTTQDTNIGNNGSGTTGSATARTISSITFTVGKLTHVDIDSSDILLKSGDTAVGILNKVGIYPSTGNDTDVRNKTVGIFNTFAFTNQRAAFAADSPIVSNYFETSPIAFRFDAGAWNKTRTIQLGHINKTWAYAQVIREGIDLYISRPKTFASDYNGYPNPVGSSPPMTYTTHAGIFVERRDRITGGTEEDVVGRPISRIATVYTNRPWGIFVEGDRSYIGDTLALNTGLTLTSVTRGAWLDIGNALPTKPQINFSSGGTAPTTPRIGDMWFDGTFLRFRLSSSTVNLTSGTSITGGSIGTSLGGGIDVYKTTVGDTLQFRSLSSTTDSSFLSVVQSGDLILISAGTALRGLSALTGSSLENLIFSELTISGTSLFDIPAPYQIYYKNLSGGTGIALSESSSLITINQTIANTTLVTGLTPVGSGSYQVLHAITNNNIVHRRLSAGTNTDITYAPDGTLVIRNTGISGNTTFTGVTDIFTFGNSPYSVIYSSITNNKIYYNTISAGTGIGIVDDGNGNLIFSGSGSGDYLSLTGGTVSGETLFLSGISATSLYTNYIDFNTGATVTNQLARLNWNDTNGTLELGLKGGFVKSELGQGLVTRVVNKTSPLIDLSGSSYHAVVIGGAQGGRLSVKLAKGDNDANSAGTLGLVAEDIAKNQEGFIITVGLLQKINTTGSLQGETWNDGDVLYLSPTTAGQLTNVKPQAPNHTVIIGYVEYAHAINGKIYIKIDNGYELDELHNVRITNPSDYNILRYDGVTYSSWTNSSINEVLSKTLLKSNIGVTSQSAQVNTLYLYDKLTITSSTATVTITSITSNVSISAYTPSIKFFANTGVTVTFSNSATLKTEGGLDAVISGDTYDSITFTYNNEIGRYFQTNINTYI